LSSKYSGCAYFATACDESIMAAKSSRLCFHCQTQRGGDVLFFLFVHWSDCGFQDRTRRLGGVLPAVRISSSSLWQLRKVEATEVWRRSCSEFLPRNLWAVGGLEGIVAGVLPMAWQTKDLLARMRMWAALL
jgi:hypothetical protein